MLFGFVTINHGEKSRSVLCMLPDKPSTFTVPVPIDSLIPTDIGVHYLSVEEGITVSREPGSDAIVIAPITPAKLYLTPNRPERPGYSVSKLKVELLGEGRYKVNFDRERGWEPWAPNVKLY